MKRSRVLIVDDEPGIRESLSGVLEDEGYFCKAVESGEQCLTELARQNFDAVLLDVWLAGADGNGADANGGARLLDGLDVLARIQEIPVGDRPEVVIISGHATIETAVKATKLGAFDFLEKPLTIEKVTVVLHNAIEQRRLELQVSRLRESGDSKVRIIGESVPMKALRQQLGLMAATNGRVLVFGESGTGKELIAHAIHAASPRADEAFIEVNCAAIPEELIESELFGHRKGSWAGALEDKTGKLQKADGGTLFLDEVADMSLKTQAKVLRALDEQRFEPVGAAESIQVDVRVVASTNKKLEEEIERGNFREDLFYRLNVIPFYVPPLRERIEDVRLLAGHFLKEFTSAYGRKPKELTEAAFQALEAYPWPGNVRELRNLMERIVIMNPQVTIDARHIPLDRSRRAVFERAMDRFGSLQEVREAAERDYILKKLEEARGNITRAAELVGLERSHLYRKMKALGIAAKE
jgi:two-component system nitrogen regulation response regulator NtrX